MLGSWKRLVNGGIGSEEVSRRRRLHLARLVRSGAIGLLVAGVLVGVPAATAQEEPLRGPLRIPDRQQTNVPPSMFGRTITLQGEVVRVLNQNAIVLDNNVLVLTRGQEVPLPRSRRPLNTLVRVRGTLYHISQYNRIALQDALGIAISGNQFIPWTGTLIVEAQALEVVPAPNTPRSVRQGAGLPPGIPGTVQEPIQSQEGISIGDVLDEPGRFAGRTIVLTGEVGREYGPFAFTLEEEGFISDDAILVVSGRPLPGWQRNELPLIPEDRTRIRGVVYQFNLQQFERGLGVDLDNALAEWNGRPVVLLTAIDLQPDRQLR